MDKTASCGFFVSAIHVRVRNGRAVWGIRKGAPGLRSGKANPHGSVHPISLGCRRLANHPKSDAPMNTLSFHETELHVIDRDGQNWLTAGEIATALGYADRSAITRIFARNADEFTDRMTLAVKLTAKGFGNGESEKEVRIFSLRGAHLVAMFARTPRAKEFRRWVLDILDRHTSKPQPAVQPPAPTPTVDVRAEMLGDLKLPTAPIPPEVAKAIECRAWDLAFEARDICKQHLLRRIAYEAQHNHPRHYIDTHEALQAIARGNLDEALAYNWATKLDTMQVLAKSHRDLAAKLVRDLEAVMAGGKRIGNV